MNDSKVVETLIALRGAPEPLFGMMLDIVRRCTSENGSEWQKLFQQAIDTGLRAQPTVVAATPKNTLVVLPSLTFSERIALGRYDWKDEDINEQRFHHNQATIGEWEYDLYHPNCSISSEDAKSSAEVDGWHVAEADHLLAFGATFPDVQQMIPIIALGSMSKIGGYPYVLGLWRFSGERYLDLYGRDGGFSADFHFLRVRRVSKV